jgi:DNA-binding transcriptional LysR family regulator
MTNGLDAYDWRSLDLNLLPVFAMLLQEGSATRAANRLRLGQPAVSSALARLRHTFGDQLFTRVPNGLVPTPRALAIATQLGPAMSAILESLRAPESFAPSNANVTVRLGMADNHEQAIMPELLSRFRAEAPGIRVAVRQTNNATAARLIDSQEIDLACGRVDKVCAWHRREVFSIKSLCLYDNKHPSLAGALTLSRFLATPHIVVSTGEDFHEIIDDALAKLGQSRQIIYSTPHFVSVPAALQRIAAVATLPDRLALQYARAYRLIVAEPPLDLPKGETTILWSAKFQDDPLHRWLRTSVADVLRMTSGEASESRSYQFNRGDRDAPIG